MNYTAEQIEESLLEIEKERQEALKEFQSDPDNIIENWEPGSYGAHGALHAASLYLDSISRHLLEHPTIISNPKWYALAYNAHTSLFNLYQAIGAEHLSEGKDNDSS